MPMDTTEARKRKTMKMTTVPSTRETRSTSPQKSVARVSTAVSRVSRTRRHGGGRLEGVERRRGAHEVVALYAQFPTSTPTATRPQSMGTALSAAAFSPPPNSTVAAAQLSSGLELLERKRRMRKRVKEKKARGAHGLAEVEAGDNGETRAALL